MRGLSAVQGRKACARPSRGRGLAAQRVEVELSPQAVERVALRLAALMGERRTAAAPELISAGELALRLGVERPWVYRNRDLLEGLRIGAGPKAPWRFDYGAAVEAMRRQQATEQNGGGL